MVAPASELVDEEHPSGYREGNFREFLDYISGNDIMKLGRYASSLWRDVLSLNRVSIQNMDMHQLASWVVQNRNGTNFQHKLFKLSLGTIVYYILYIAREKFRTVPDQSKACGGSSEKPSRGH
ncbi:hypothetical protein LOK49_LG02G00841 [Camellia lanceoleosa]|uniref:Uncharacterized protein n=1 Tax=Camellia lanceoleosa TaxID=1840588 RepID=A0ACC0ILN1_9ERIC|nr:hypothetical protein LOK49_LG02G00841 [Camellia lanceoleosa]